jgi:hypothetical protein
MPQTEFVAANRFHIVGVFDMGAFRDTDVCAGFLPA